MYHRVTCDLFCKLTFKHGIITLLWFLLTISNPIEEYNGIIIIYLIVENPLKSKIYRVIRLFNPEIEKCVHRVNIGGTIIDCES